MASFKYYDPQDGWVELARTSYVSGSYSGSNWTSLTINGVTKNIAATGSYLPLSAGSSYPLTGDLYLSNNKKVTISGSSGGLANLGVETVGSGVGAQSVGYVDLLTGNAIVGGATRITGNYIQKGSYKLNYPSLSADAIIATRDWVTSNATPPIEIVDLTTL